MPPRSAGFQPARGRDARAPGEGGHEFPGTGLGAWLAWRDADAERIQSFLVTRADARRERFGNDFPRLSLAAYQICAEELVVMTSMYDVFQYFPHPSNGLSKAHNAVSLIDVGLEDLEPWPYAPPDPFLGWHGIAYNVT